MKVIVIGAGVIELSVATAAQARGLCACVIDREGPAAGASVGNSGAFVFTDILPLASPGILRKAPKWLLDPLGPLSVPPSYALKIAPWMSRLWRASRPARVAQSTAAQTALMDLSKASLEPFLAATGTAHMLRKRGNLQVYEGEPEFGASLPGFTAREMADIHAGLAPRFTHGTFTPGWYSIADPKLYTQALADHFIARGGVLRRGDVTALKPVPDVVDVLTADGTTHRADKVVLAAGEFSHRIARTWGEAIPLETERGYNTTFPPGAFDLRMQITFGGHGFVVSSLSTGIRVGGAAKLAGLDLPPNYKHADAMLTQAQQFLPALKITGGTQWMGFRPSLLDSLPAIGFARHSNHVIYAFGHGQLGLTQSTGKARLVADLLTGETPAIELTPFSPQRF